MKVQAREIRVGMIGCGVVGEGVLRLLRDHAADIRARIGGDVVVRRISALRPDRVRDDIVPREKLTFDAYEVIDDPDIDVVIELVGGLDPAGALVRTAIARGRSVVTANKALLATHGHELIEAAEARGVDLYFEAAVGGGIPIVRVLREALASDRLLALRGIVNGTSNYILSSMRSDGTSFSDALVAAQRAGYAEADPTLDINGGDAAHKLVILATLGFGARVAPSDVTVSGIDSVAAVDIELARRFGFAIKPVAVARLHGTDALELRVNPALVRESSVLASISGATNAIYVEGAALGPCVLSGRGAGALPTAVSVVSDVVDIGRNLFSGARGRVPQRAFRGTALQRYRIVPEAERRARFYLRFAVLDRPAVLSRIAGVLGAFDVSIETMVQEGRAKDTTAPVSIVMLTHEAVEENVSRALAEVRSLQQFVESVHAIRIDEG